MTSILPTNCQLELISDSVVEQYRFHEQEYVAATLGTKGGPVCAPLLQYKALTDNSIEIYDHNGSIAVWSNIQVDADTVHVQCSGKTKTFWIKR